MWMQTSAVAVTKLRSSRPKATLLERRTAMGFDCSSSDTPQSVAAGVRTEQVAAARVLVRLATPLPRRFSLVSDRAVGYQSS
jgi:hypothetical protein